MANKKISELVSRTPSLTDLMLVGDPSSGYSYKCTVTALATIIETDIADGYVTLATAQTISGAKTFSNVLTLTNVANSATDTDKFLVLTASNVVNYRTGTQVLSDIGAQAALTNPVTGTGTTNYLPKFTGTSTIGNSQLIDDGTTIFLGTSGSLPNVKMIISTTSQRALELTSTTGNALFVSSGGAYVMTVTNGTWATQFTQAGRLDLGGDLSITTIANATTDTDKFLVSDAGVVKYRTGAEVLSDIGGASSSSISGTTNYIPKFTSSSAIGNSVIYESGGSIYVGGNLNLQGAVTRNINFYDNTNTNLNAQIQYDQIASNSGQLIFSTNNSGSFSERMRLDASGNLGLGISAPNELLSLNATGNVNIHLTNATSGTTTNDGFKVGFNTSLNAYLLNKEAGSILFYTSDALRATLDASGNLGLGVTPSAWRTQTKAFQIGDGNLRGESSLVGLGLNYYVNSSNQQLYVNSDYATNYIQLLGQHIWFTAPSGTAGNAISFTQAMTLDASGNLGVGTTSPSGTIHASRNASGYVGVFYNSNASGEGVTIRGGSSSSQNSLVVQDYNGSTNILIARSDGNVGIGTTSPDSKLQVTGTIKTSDATNDASVILTGLDGAYGLIQANNNAGTLTKDLVLQKYGGNVGINTSVPQFSLALPQDSKVGWNDAASAKRGSITVNSSADAMVFATGTSDTERMRITSGGEVLINTTSDAGDYKLQVNGNGYFTGSGNTAVIVRSTNDFPLFQLSDSRALGQTWNIENGRNAYGELGFYAASGGVGNALTLAHSTGNATFSGSIKTAAPSGGTAKPFKIGAAAVVSPTSPNRTIEIEIDGTTYYLSAKTTND